MTAFKDAPCEPWPVTWCVELTEEQAAVSGAAVEASSSILWKLSGRRFGLCEMTFRPCRDNPRDSMFIGWWNAWPNWGTYPQPWLYRGQWFNLTCGSCSGGCQCERLEQFRLPGPVASIIEIKIDGEVVPTGSYRVDNWLYVVRTDGGEWPRCNNLNKNDTEEGTWSVTASMGEDVPPEATFANGELAAEILAACFGDECNLSPRVQSLARQGVNMTFLDPNVLLNNGRTGLYFCDLFLDAVNPTGIRARARVYFIDGRNPRRPNT